MNTTTRRFSRSLSEAFGPHTSRYIYTEPTPMDAVDKMVVAAAALLAVFALTFVALS